MESEELEATHVATAEAPAIDPAARLVKSDNLYKYVLKMRKKIADEKFDYVEECLLYLLSDDKKVNNCVMYTDVENEEMDQPIWYFGLDSVDLRPVPIDVEKVPDYENYSLIIISSGESICISGNWRDCIVCPMIDRDKLFANIKHAKGYNPIFANVSALKKSNCGKLTLFYSREIPIMFNMTEWNLAHGSFKDEDGNTHIALSRGQGIVVKFKDLINNPEKYAAFCVEGQDSIEDRTKFYISSDIPEESEFAKYKRLPGVVMRRSVNGKLFPSVELTSISDGEPPPYKESSKDMTDYCVLLKT